MKLVKFSENLRVEILHDCFLRGDRHLSFNGKASGPWYFYSEFLFELNSNAQISCLSYKLDNS